MDFSRPSVHIVLPLKHPQYNISIGGFTQNASPVTAAVLSFLNTTKLKILLPSVADWQTSSFLILQPKIH